MMDWSAVVGRDDGGSNVIYLTYLLNFPTFLVPKKYVDFKM